MMNKLLPLAIAGMLLSAPVLAADVGVDVNVAGIPVQKSVEVDTTGVENAANNASAQGQAGLEKAAAAKGKLSLGLDKKLKQAKGHAALLDSVAGTNASAKLDAVETKKAEAETAADAGLEQAAAAKQQGDAAVQGAGAQASEAPAAASEKLQGKINKKLGFGL